MLGVLSLGNLDQNRQLTFVVNCKTRMFLLHGEENVCSFVSISWQGIDL